MNPRLFLFALLSAASASLTLSADDTALVSHPPMRPLPVPSSRQMPADAVCFVDAKTGDDSQPGTREMPWKTIAASLGKLKPGDTLCLRGGTYYESVNVTVSGTAEKPLTICAYPGELPILDAGIREFFETPATAWEPFAGGAPGEFRSVKSYEEGGGAGNFGDSMIPLHRYLTFSDLRSANELWREESGGRAEDPVGIYCGPGTRRDEATGRIHARLAHTELAGLGDRAYRGETDPRKVPLVVPLHDYALQIRGAGHIRIEDVVMRGGRRAAALIEDSADIVLDGVTLFGAQMALRTARVNGLRITDSALRGHAAPWHSRAHHKYRAQAGYLVIADGDNFEFENCELTDNHDFLLLFGVENIRIHGCLVDNFNDDGFEPGPKRAHGKILIFQNLISRCLSPFTAHGKKPVPVDSEPGSGVYVFRNIADLRRGIYKFPPEKPDPSGAFLDEPVEILAHDHGSPLHPNYYVYQNTFLMRRGGASDSYAFTWGAHTHGTARRVFNNLFVQAEGTPRNVFTALSAEDDFQSDANLFWSLKGEEPQSLEIFAKFRQSPLFAASRRQYAPGWGNSDILADPQFVSPDKVGARPCDLRLRESSPAARAGIALPADWPDPLRPAGEARPDIGALPIGADAPRFGIHGRIAVDGTESKP